LIVGNVQPMQVLKSLSSKDVALWLAYDRLYPFGQQRTDFLIAQLTAVCFNLWKGKTTEPKDTDDFLGKRVELTEEYVSATLRTFKHGTN